MEHNTTEHIMLETYIRRINIIEETNIMLLIIANCTIYISILCVYVKINTIELGYNTVTKYKIDIIVLQ